MKKILLVSLILLISMNLCGIGVGLFIQSNLGGDTMTIIQEGMSKTFSISLGNASRIFNLIFFIIALIIARKHIGWVTIVNGLLVGTFIDFYNLLFIQINLIHASLWIRILAVMIGQICLILSFSLLIEIRNGMNFVDAAAYGIEQRTSLSFKAIRTIFDILFVVIGAIMGGVVGIGSIFAMLTTGIGIDYCTKGLNQVQKALANKN